MAKEYTISPVGSVRYKIPALAVLAFVLGGGVISVAGYALLHRNADRETQEKASMLISTLEATRAKTLASSGPADLSCPYSDRRFADSYSALQGQLPYVYRQVAQNPTNSANEADAIETKLITTFQTAPARTRIDEEVTKRDGKYWLSAVPITMSQDKCVKCHSVPQIAPIGRVKSFPRSGFNWKRDSVVGAAIAYVPSGFAHAQADKEFVTILIMLVGLGIFCIALVVISTRSVVCRPVMSLIDTSKSLRKGEWNARFITDQAGEIGALAESLQDTTFWLRERLAREEKLRSMFQQFVPAPVAARALGHSSERILTGARHPVSVLFLNIRNFKLLMENLDPGDTVTTLNEFFTAVNSVIVKHNGIVSKYLGDSVLAFFGMPMEDSKHALNAVKAAMAIPAALQDLYVRLDEKYGWELGVGIGISTGEPIVGHFGADSHMEYTVLGDVVIEAHKLEGLTKATPEEDTILIAEATFRLVMSDVHVLDVGEKELAPNVKLHAYAVQGFRSEARNSIAA